MKGKQFVIATIFASVLLAVMFIPTSTRSEPSAQAPAQYNAWYDVNGDGKIDMSDLAALSQAYGSTGDPTRNVNVLNKQQPDPPWQAYMYRHFNLTWGIASGYAGSYGYAGGYRVMYITVDMQSIQVSASVYNKTVDITVDSMRWYMTNQSATAHPFVNEQLYTNLPLNLTSMNTRTPKWFTLTYISNELTVKGPYVMIFPNVYSPDTPTGWLAFDMWLYFRE